MQFNEFKYHLNSSSVLGIHPQQRHVHMHMESLEILKAQWITKAGRDLRMHLAQLPVPRMFSHGVRPGRSGLCPIRA